MHSLNQYRKNVYSQNGEDGVIEEICARIGIREGSFVEFGAWDGRKLSNSYHLLTQGWKGVYIEGDPDKYRELLETCRPYSDRVIALCAFVGSEGDQTLDALLAGCAWPRDFDLLSIDIDSADWQVWAAVKNHNPKIVIIEINGRIPPGVLHVHRPGGITGSSFSSTLALGLQKGYVLACHMEVNMIFVRSDLAAKLSLPDLVLQHPEILYDYKWCHLSRLYSPDFLAKFGFVRTVLAKLGIK